MTQVQLPDGCSSLKLEDGTRYRAPRQGGTVDVEPEHARAIDRHYGRLGIMRGGITFAIGTKTGRFCGSCNRVWNCWSLNCPRCGRDTERT